MLALRKGIELVAAHHRGRHPAWRQRVATSPTILPWSVCSSSRPSPVTTKADALIASSKPIASST